MVRDLVAVEFARAVGPVSSLRGALRIRPWSFLDVRGTASGAIVCKIARRSAILVIAAQCDFGEDVTIQLTRISVTSLRHHPSDLTAAHADGLEEIRSPTMFFIPSWNARNGKPA